MIQLAINGCRGRMGERITRLALADPAFNVKTLMEHADHPKISETVDGMTIQTSAESLNGCDVLIDFTTPEATMEKLDICLSGQVKMVIGTTGLTATQQKKIKEASQTIPIVFASNMSVGVNILFKLAQLLADKVPDSYAVKIKEAHHIHKKDAPSGTAKTLAEIIESQGNKKVADIESIREGEIIGDHEVVLESPEDIISIKHHAKDRDIFAKGSLVAAKFLMDKSSGLYTMQEVLGLK